VTAYPAWTPASRPGIIPLHPLSFGTILGRSFVALRQNPRVLLGFALVVQTVAYLLVIAAVGAIGFASFSRLDTVRPGTSEFDTILAGSIAITAVAGVVLGLAAGALSVIVQGIVVSEVAHAAVAEKLTLGALWQAVKPVAWRLIGYSFLLVLAVIVGVGVLAAALFGIGVASPPAAIAVTIVLVLAAIPLVWWLTTKLMLTPAVIILERATIGGAIARSWRLIRGRFWVALGVIIVISITFGVVSQVISIPFTFLSTGLSTIIAPTGADEPSAIIGVVVVLLLTQVVTLLIQSVAIVVQSTATALVYIDCRMRHEGLDLDLLAYVERRDAGATALPDPYREHIGREITPRGTGSTYAQGGYAVPGYTAGPYTGAYPQGPSPQGPYPAPGYGAPAQAQRGGPPAFPPPAGYRQAPPPAPPAPTPPAVTAPPSATARAAPRTSTDDGGTEPQWP
jgi:hypothetical protein